MLGRKFFSVADGYLIACFDKDVTEETVKAIAQQHPFYAVFRDSGMAYTERKAVAWLYKHRTGSIYYSATPVYKGKELIPRSVVVDIKTSDGKINERVIVYNAAKGYKVDYKKGTLTGTEEEDKEEKKEENKEQTHT